MNDNPDSMTRRIAQKLHELTVKNGGVSRSPHDMMDDARALIGTMLAPTPEMTRTGGEQIGVDGHQITAQIAGWAWERMIEATARES